MRLPGEDHASPRLQADQAPKSTERLGDSLVGLQKPEDTDEWRRRFDTQPSAPGEPVSVEDPRTVRDHADGSGETRGATLGLDAVAVRNRASRPSENPAQ